MMEDLSFPFNSGVLIYLLAPPRGLVYDNYSGWASETNYSIGRL